LKLSTTQVHENKSTAKDTNLQENGKEKFTTKDTNLHENRKEKSTTKGYKPTRELEGGVYS